MSYLSRISSGISRLDNLVNDLLAYSKTGSGVLNVEKVDLNEVIELIKLDYVQLIEEKKLVIKGKDLPYVHADKMFLQILIKRFLTQLNTQRIRIR